MHLIDMYDQLDVLSIALRGLKTLCTRPTDLNNRELHARIASLEEQHARLLQRLQTTLDFVYSESCGMAPCTESTSPLQFQRRIVHNLDRSHDRWSLRIFQPRPMNDDSEGFEAFADGERYLCTNGCRTVCQTCNQCQCVCTCAKTNSVDYQIWWDLASVST